MKLLELFSGYGTSSFALKRLGISFEIVGYSDIDKYANQCFRQNHLRNMKQPIKGDLIIMERELNDVRKINPNDLEDFDLLTAGFPCQSFSNAGKMQGEADPRGTLFYEIIRIAEVKQPKYMLLENVKGLTSKKFKDTFNKILSELDRIGYNVYWKVLNSKDFGIPQSRARVWFVCFRKDLNIRFINENNQVSLANLENAKTPNDTHNIIELGNQFFKFPEPTELKIFIKDILEEEVDNKYYLSKKLQERFKEYLNRKLQVVNLQPRNGKGIGGKGIISKEDGTIYCIDSNNSQAISVQLANMNRGKVPYNPQGREIGFQLNKEPISFTIKQTQHEFLVYDRKGFDSRTKGFRESELSPTLSQKMGPGGNNVPMVAISNCSAREYGFKEKISPILCSRDYKDAKIVNLSGQLRKLTPKECFRLMGFLNDEIILDGLSDTQKYKLAGNGQDVNMVSLIFKEMLK